MNPSSRRTGFTLVELLVCLAVIAILTALLLPALSQAKASARIAVCAGTFRAHGQFFGMYASDCRDFLPPPNSPHRMRQGANNWVGTAFTTLTIGAPSCPDNPGNNPRTHPNGYAWFYWMGYVPSLWRGPGGGGIGKCAKVTNFECPDAPIFRNSTLTTTQFHESQYRIFSIFSQAYAAHDMYTGANPHGASVWDCQPIGSTAYLYRGVLRVNSLSATTVRYAPRTADWAPSNILAVENEYVDSYTAVGQPTYIKDMDVHGDGMNMLYHDGHVAFGGKNINGYRPAIYYSMVFDGQSEFNARVYSSNAISCTIAAGTSVVTSNGNLRLWKYYEGW